MLLQVFCLQTKIGITSGFIHHPKVPQRDLQVSKSSTSGLAKPCSFGKVIGLAVEFDANIFVTMTIRSMLPMPPAVQPP